MKATLACLRIVFLLFPLIPLFPYTSAAQGYPQPEPGIDVLHYRFFVEINDRSDSIAATAVLRVEWQEEVSETISLDLIGPREEYPGFGMTASQVLIGEDTCQFSQNGLELIITLPAVQAGDTADIVIDYSGKPADGLVISTNMYGERTFFGDNWPVRGRYYLPVVDHPSEKATCEWVITAPNHYQVVANGALITTIDLTDSTRLHHYHCFTPLAPKVMVFGAARFAVKHLGMLRNIPVSAWVYPRAQVGGFYDYELALPILAYFDSLIAPYPFSKLANVQSTTRFGGMENASNVFYDERSVTGQRSSEGLIAHELAHQWFGNSASEADWPHLWLSEGFATYFASLWLAHAHGEERLWQELDIDRQTIFRAAPNVPLVPPVVKDPMSLLNANSYEKGGWVLHMLRLELGDEAFFNGVRAYYNSHQGSNATTDQLQAALEESSGKDLDYFFEQWVHGTGYPELAVSWTWADSSLDVKVRQMQPAGQRWDVPLELGIRLEGESDIRFIQIRSDKRTVSESFPMPSRPKEVLFDPRMTVLGKGRVEG